MKEDSEKDEAESDCSRKDRRIYFMENGVLTRKFMPRESLLLKESRETQMGVVFNLIKVLILMEFVYTALDDFRTTGRVNLGSKELRAAFSSFPEAFYIWIKLQVPTFLNYFGYKIWAKYRASISEESIETSDETALCVYMVNLVAHVAFPMAWIITSDVSCVLRLFLVVEQMRTIMKSYVFVRTNVPRTLKNNGFAPSFGQFSYYMFAPTVIYCDEYPRNKKIDWIFFRNLLVEIMIIALVLVIAIYRYLIPWMESVGKPGFSMQYCLMQQWNAALVGLTVMLSVAYGCVTLFYNAVAELMRFADRRFDEDWWNAENPKDGSRRWHVVTYEFTLIFLHTDFSKRYFENRFTQKIVTFLITSVTLDYITSMALGHPIYIFLVYVPILNILCIVMEKMTSGNFSYWFFMISKWSSICVYPMAEYFSRINCPYEEESKLNYFIPRLLTCPHTALPTLFEGVF